MQLARRLSHARDADDDLASAIGDNVLVALPEDRMDLVLGRLSRYPRGATIAVLEDDRLVLVQMKRVRKAAADDDDCPIHPDTLVAMWLAYLRVAPGRVTCYLAPGFRMELVGQPS